MAKVAPANGKKEDKSWPELDIILTLETTNKTGLFAIHRPLPKLIKCFEAALQWGNFYH
jgi:hypothetical protein